MLGKKSNEIKISSLIGSSATLEGDFSVPGSVRIDGCVNGNVTVGGTLIVGSTGTISGNVSAEAVIIGGEIVGDVEAPQKAELTGTAKVLGDITTAVIVIDENAVFQGKCNMNQQVPDKKAKAKTAQAVKASKRSAKAALAEALREVQEAEDRERLEATEQEGITQENSVQEDVTREEG